MAHPATELVAATCRKILKAAPKKYARLVEEAGSLLAAVESGTALRLATLDEPPHVPAAGAAPPPAPPPPPPPPAAAEGEEPAAAPPPPPAEPPVVYAYSPHAPGAPLCYASAAAVVRVLRLAVECERVPVVEAALDCAQRLIAYRFLQARRAALAERSGALAARRARSAARPLPLLPACGLPPLLPLVAALRPPLRGAGCRTLRAATAAAAVARWR